MKNGELLIIDFDSTFVKIEALDYLAKISLEGSKARSSIASQIEKITKDGMEGKIGFAESLEKRISLLHISKRDIKKLVEILDKNITKSFLENREFFINNSENIYIISGGFQEYIYDTVSSFGIKKDHIFANTFVFDSKGNVKDYDRRNPLSKDKGKVKCLHLLSKKNKASKIIIIGDGITDYQPKEEGVANAFYAFTENISRAGVVAKADKVLRSFDDFLYINNLPRRFSYPKNLMKALFLEKIDQSAVDYFSNEGYSVEQVSSALSEDELIEKIKDVSILGIRSKTEVTKKVLEVSRKLLAVGAFCIGTNQIDLVSSSQKGVAVFNAPFSNTRSVVELVIGNIIMLYRKAFDKSAKMHNGIWDKSSEGCFEVRGKSLGIIGYGNIGTQLGIIAEALGMKVYFYDISDKLSLGNAVRCESLNDLLSISDVVTVHVDGRASNKFLIGKKEFEKMKDGVIFLNLSRGHIVDIDALADAIKNKKVAGCSVDVFPYEPKSNKDPFVSNLQNLPNTILTPHVGGSTTEAQKNIGEFVAKKIIEFINTGNTMLSVNFPNIILPPQGGSHHRFIHIHENKPGVLAHINSILAQNKINIEGQYLKTNDYLGYVITDVSREYSEEVIKKLKNISGTLKFRVLY